MAIEPTTDPLETAAKVIHRYRSLWGELSEGLVVMSV